MKKSVIIFVISLLSLNCWANPMPSHFVYLTQLSFEGTAWKLGITTFMASQEEPIDSILITSTTGTILIDKIPTGEGTEVFFIDSDSIVSGFSIKPDGDIITITGYFGGYEITPLIFNLTELRFGNAEEAELAVPSSKQLIKGVTYGFEKDWDFSRFVICEKDAGETLCTGTLTGKLYDQNGNVQKYGRFWLDDWFTLDENGNYSVEVLPYRHEINTIFYSEIENSETYFHNYVDITPLNFEIKPDTTINMDIYLQEKTYNTAPENVSKSGIKIYPNPASSHLTIAFKNTNLPDDNVIIHMIDSNGQLVMKENFSLNFSTNYKIDISAFSPGLYTLKIKQNNKNIISKKVIINSF